MDNQNQQNEQNKPKGQPQNPLFRQKSLEKISSPEELHDYMRVTSPRLWMILSAIVLLLAGFIVYASTTSMENTMPIKVNIDNYEFYDDETAEANGEVSRISIVTASLPIMYKDSINTGMEVRVCGVKGIVEYMGMSTNAAENTEDGDPGTPADGADPTNNTVYINFRMEQDYIPVASGEYDAELVLESTTPISFLWN